jgi:pyrroloquinoline quinone biosynthesis protein B
MHTGNTSLNSQLLCRALLCCVLPGLALWSCAGRVGEASKGTATDDPFLIVLGTAQDGGVPQAGDKHHEAWNDPELKRHAVSLAVVDPKTSQRWILDATPDFREQLHQLDEVFPVDGRPGLAGILLTHAHMGHYTGLMHLGLEAMGARKVPVYAMPRMRDFLAANGPWSQLVNYENIVLEPLADGIRVTLNERISVTPFLVPHRQEYSEVVGFRIDGQRRSVLFIPDIDSWKEWDESGTRVETMIAAVDVAYLDGTFYSGDEIPGRDMSSFPHPRITESMKRFGALPSEERAKIRFIHLNHTNPALEVGGSTHRAIENNGFGVAVEGERIGL